MSDAAAAAPAPAAAPAKKAPKATKPKGEKKSGNNYVAIVKEAIVALKERGGSSVHAIRKYVESKGYPKTLGAGWEKRLSLAVKAMAKSGSLVKGEAPLLQGAGPTLHVNRGLTSTASGSIGEARHVLHSAGLACCMHR